MKVTFRAGRIGSANHNDRSYPGGERTEEVRILVRDGNRGRALGPSEHLEELERRFYRERYGASVEAQNERNRAARHPERCRTTDDLYRGARTKPLEVILQVGNHAHHPDPELFKRTLNDFTMEFRRKYGSHCQMLSMALHNDEMTPHVHLRVIFDIPGKNGPIINQTQALRRMGVPLPDPDRPESRYNCRLQTWTEQCREMWINICREQGLRIENPQKCNREHLSIRDYKAAAAREKERSRSLDRDLER